MKCKTCNSENVFNGGKGVRVCRDCQHTWWTPDNAYHRSVTPPAGEFRWLTVITNEQVPEVNVWPDEASARDFFEQASLQWSECFLCRVIVGPRETADELGPEHARHPASPIFELTRLLEKSRYATFLRSIYNELRAEPRPVAHCQAFRAISQVDKRLTTEKQNSSPHNYAALIERVKEEAWPDNTTPHKDP